MAPPVIIEELFSDRVVELGRLSGAEAAILGREPEFGIKIPNASAVSREHGIFIPSGSHWIYKDLGSTNGSFHRGKELPPESPIVLRIGEVIQLADHLIRLTFDTSIGVEQPKPSQSLLVFVRGQVGQEFPTSAQGKLLSIGGSKSDLKLEVDIEEHASIIVERRGQGVVAFSVSKAGNPLLNGDPMAAPVTLTDRDCLTVGIYKVFFLDELHKSIGITSKVAFWEGGEVADDVRETTSSSKYIARRAFGQLPEAKGSPKTEAFAGRRSVLSGAENMGGGNFSSTIILVLVMVLFGALGLVVAFLL